MTDSRSGMGFLGTAVLTVLMAGQVAAMPLVNGDFETGTMAGWTTFVTSPYGSIASGFPTIMSFDTDGDSNSSLSARLRVGSTQIFQSGGGGIYQNVALQAGDLTIDADAAATSASSFGEAHAGVVELLFDGSVVDQFNFGAPPPFGTVRTSLQANISGISAGVHEIRIQFIRTFGHSTSSPLHNIDDVVLSGSAAAVPEPSTLLLLGTGLVGLIGYGRRRKREE